MHGLGRCVLNGGCQPQGQPVSSATTCCSRGLFDPGFGAAVCAPVTGCEMAGEVCTSTQACCGGGTNPNGSVLCVQATSSPLGRCDNGQACNPVGNLCGATFPLPDGGTSSINASQNCCDGKAAVCKLDSTGLPRCFGGGTTTCPSGHTGQPPCCLGTGQACQFKDQCCNGAPCVPGSTGSLVCAGSSCQPSGQVCTASADCCSGLFCHQPGSAAAGTCQPGTCAGAGQPCSATISCCGQLACSNPQQQACQPGQSCSCRFVF